MATADKKIPSVYDPMVVNGLVNNRWYEWFRDLSTTALQSIIAITAGIGLSGGGTIDGDITLNLDIDSLTSDTSIGSTDTIPIYDGSVKKITFANFESNLNHDNLSGFNSNEHIDWTSTSSNFSTSGTAATGALSVTGNISVSGTVDGRDVATDGAKLDTAFYHIYDNGSGTLAANQTYYLAAGAASTNEDEVIIPLVRAGTLDRIYINVDAAPGAGESFTYTVRINKSDTSMTGTISNTSTSVTITTNTQAVSLDDLFSIKLVTSTSAGASHHRFTARVTYT